MGAFSYYISTLVVYFGIDLLSAWSLNLQYGYAGVINFSFIIFQAVGAYIASTVVLGPDTGVNAYQSYIFGANLPWPVPLILAAAAGAALSAVIGIFALRRIRRDYQAAVMLIVSLIALQVVSADVHLFNGSNGLTGIPRPLGGFFNVALSTYEWYYAAFVLVICAAVYVLVQKLCRSSWGRSLRAMRDQEDAAASIGLNPTVLRMQVFIIGGAIAGLSGGLLVEFIGAWSPGAWGYAETFVIFTALLVGGVGNNRGMIIGVFLVPILFLELPRYLPAFGYPGLIDALEWIVIGALWMLGLFVRPRGLLPERRFIASRDGLGFVTAGGSPPGFFGRLLLVGRGGEAPSLRWRKEAVVPAAAPGVDKGPSAPAMPPEGPSAPAMPPEGVEVR